MPKRIAVSKLNASTLDILNTIRANASSEYQSLVPEVTSEHDIPKVGEVLYGYPALANQFINSLVNRIALVRIKSATFNNDYAELKKGYLAFGETVEEVFVSLAKAREFSAEKAASRELKRTLPDVRSAFHAMNWRVQYPVTVQQEDLRMAFTSMNGVQDLITKIVDSVYQAANYDEYLLFKYLMIKAIAHGKMYPVAVDTSDAKNLAISFRSTSNKLTFMGTNYNASGVHTTTQKGDQYIFMDSDLNAQYDVNVLAGAFNMDKADFIGRLKLIDDWTTFDNERFDIITEASDMIEPVTTDELALMANVKAVIVDREWFQVYDNQNLMTETYVASGEYWNYFYNVWKTVSSSPFSNAIVFVDDDAETDLPETVKFEITGKDVSELGTVFTLELEEDDEVLNGGNVNFVQNEDCVENGVAVHKYGAIIMPPNSDAVTLSVTINGVEYEATSTLATTADVGDELSFQSSTLSLTISNPSASDNLLGKVVADLQTNVVFGNHEITGTLKYVTGYTGYSETVAEQSGNYLAIKAAYTTGATCKVKLENSTIAEKTLDSTGIAIFRITNKDTQKLRFTVTKDSDTFVSVYDLDELVLNEE